MTRNKIALIGSGNIGSTLAHLAILKNLGDVVLVDVAEGLPQGKALDLAQCCPIEGIDVSVTGSNTYEVIKDADVVIVTAGIPRKPGMRRDDLLATNASIITSVAHEIKKHAPNAFVIVITNPLDVMVQLMQEVSGLPKNHVVGMAGILDTARYCHFLAEELGVSIKDISAFVMGGHGDSMVPLPRFTTIAGVPLPEIIESGWISQAKVNSIIERTRNGGAEIVGMLKTGSAYYAPASSAIEMAETYLFNQKRILPCAAKLSGEYGVNDLYVGVPVIIGAKGVEKIIELKLTSDEKAAFDSSVTAGRGLLNDLTKINAMSSNENSVKSFKVNA